MLMLQQIPEEQWLTIAKLSCLSLVRDPGWAIRYRIIPAVLSGQCFVFVFVKGKRNSGIETIQQLGYGLPSEEAS